MKSRNIFKSLPIFSLLLSIMIIFAACDRNETHGTKSGEEGEEPEAYGLQQNDLPGEGEDPKAKDNQINAAEGETQKMASDNREGEYNEDEAQYPEEKIEEETNLEDNEPIELSGPLDIQKKMLMASLNSQKTDLQHQIRELSSTPGNSEGSNVAGGNVEELREYVNKLDQEMANVRAAEEQNFEEVAESAQSAIEGAGALIVSRDMRITEGY